MFETFMVILGVYITGAVVTSFVIGKVNPDIGNCSYQADYGVIALMSFGWPVTATVVAPFYFASRKRR